MSPRHENPALTVDAVWIRSGRVLLVRRGRPPFRGFWAFPGGFVELRETVEEALVRELREETGLSGHPVGVVGVYSGPDRDPRKPTTTVAFLVNGRGGNPVGHDDAASAAWVPLSEARPLAFDHERILADAGRLYRRTRRRRHAPSARTSRGPRKS
ncbi:MAG: NUDIX hydrolase [Thermoplasmata archaeon]|jgi:8-oxo-dGTP diphosphatase